MRTRVKENLVDLRVVVVVVSDDGDNFTLGGRWVPDGMVCFFMMIDMKVVLYTSMYMIVVFHDRCKIYKE